MKYNRKYIPGDRYLVLKDPPGIYPQDSIVGQVVTICEVRTEDRIITDRYHFYYQHASKYLLPINGAR
jgi:hypothetical protein